MNRRRFAACLVMLTLLAGACSNASDDAEESSSDETTATGDDAGPLTYAEVLELPIDENVPVEAPGVDDSTIRVGGVASTTNPIGGKEGESFDGVHAYFEYMNSQGGVYGRDLELVAEEDDNTGFENTQDIQSLLTQDLFAVLPVATLDFSGAELLVDAGMPTFGWNINEEYALGDNLFGMRGYLCFTCAGPLLPWLAQEIGSTNVGVLAYDVPQSSSCSEGIQNSFDTYPTAEVAFLDASLPYGIPDLSAQVRDMKAAGVDMVATCMDFNGAITIQQEMHRQELDAIQYMPNAYDYDFLEEFGDLFEGAYVLTQFVPFEAEDPARGPRHLPGVDRGGRRHGERAQPGRLDLRRHVRHRPPGRRPRVHPAGRDRRPQHADRLHGRGHHPRPRLDHRTHRRLRSVLPGPLDHRGRRVRAAVRRARGAVHLLRHDRGRDPRGPRGLAAEPRAAAGSRSRARDRRPRRRHRRRSRSGASSRCWRWASSSPTRRRASSTWPSAPRPSSPPPSTTTRGSATSGRSGPRSCSPSWSSPRSSASSSTGPCSATCARRARSPSSSPPSACSWPSPRSSSSGSGRASFGVQRASGPRPTRSAAPPSTGSATTRSTATRWRPSLVDRSSPSPPSRPCSAGHQLGLRMRAVVESPRMTELTGINADRISTVAWMLSSLFAGLAGVLLAPLFAQVDVEQLLHPARRRDRRRRVRAASSIPLTLAGGIAPRHRPAAALAGYLPADSVLVPGPPAVAALRRPVPAAAVLARAAPAGGRPPIRSPASTPRPRPRRPRCGPAGMTITTRVARRRRVRVHRRRRAPCSCRRLLGPAVRQPAIVYAVDLPARSPSSPAWAARSRCARRPSRPSGPSPPRSWSTTTTSRS